MFLLALTRALSLSGLFDWVVDSDVLHGRAPFELRVRREPSAVRLSAEWDRVAHELCAELGDPQALEEQLLASEIVL